MGITAERMQVMKDMASHMKALGEMLEGRVAYDARQRGITLWRSTKIVTRWPPSFPMGAMTITAGLIQRSGSNLKSLGRRWTISSMWSANSS